MDTNEDLNVDLPNLLADPTWLDDCAPAEHAQLRLQRILEYMLQALANPNVLESNLASINAGLLRMALWLEEKIDEATKETPTTPELMKRVYQAIDMHLRVARQIDRFSQIELRATAPHKPGPKATIRVDLVGNDAGESTAESSEDSAS